ncbi:MAG: Protein FecR [Pseudomonas citronellolis]|nr:MAG: Protein FecR [Pseudomonas citronellolis]
MRPPDAGQQRVLLAEAARWYAQLCAAQEDDVLLRDWQRWRAQSSEHHWAWTRVEALQQQLGRLPGGAAYEAMAGTPRGVSRRQVLRGAVLLLGSAALAGGGYRVSREQAWLADYRTGVGERRQFTLPDATRITLDTASAVDLHFSAERRLLVLRRGRLRIDTAADAQRGALQVRTAEGLLLSDAASFCVRQLDGCSELDVLQHSVLARAGLTQAEQLVAAGQRLRLYPQHPGRPEHLPAAAASWSDGWLVVDAWRLGELLGELGRYRRGLLQCDPAVADLRLSGAYPLDAPNDALAAVQRALPVRVQRFSDYWVRVLPASA